jgi:cell wall-associated NlpC family hydrolase
VNPKDESLANLLKGASSFALRGKKMKAEIKNAITGANIVRTIDGAPTFDISIEDKQRVIIESGILGKGVTVAVGPFTYVMVSISKSGHGLTVTSEDQAVNVLRKKTDPIKVAPGVMNHVQFAKRLVNEVPWLKFKTDPSAHVVPSKEALTRGDPSAGADGESDSWSVLSQNAQARGWRCFVRGVDEVWYVPDSFLLKQATIIDLKEGKNGVDNIDFEYDEGQDIAEATVTCRAGLWEVPPSQLVKVRGLGPANGKWIVKDISRSPFHNASTITIVQPQPQLPEPTGDTGSGDEISGVGDATQTVGTGSGGVAPDRTNSKSALDFVAEALSQVGKTYVFGATPSPASNNPTSFDCSSLVQWAAGRVGVTLPRTSQTQWAACRSAGTSISVENAIKTRGALLFEAGSDGTPDSPGHVAISLGNGDTVEAYGTGYGVRTMGAAGRSWSHAGLCPGMDY